MKVDRQTLHTGVKPALATSLLCLLAACGGGGGGGSSVPGAPSAVSATTVGSANTVQVSFTAPSSNGGSTITGYAVSSTPAGVTATGTASPITVTCPGSCAGKAFSVAAVNAIGQGSASAAADVITKYQVTTTFFEPMTQPDNSIFKGSFTFDATTGTVSQLSGTLTESMYGNGVSGAAYPDGMPLVTLSNQLSAKADSTGTGLLVTSFLLNTTNTFDVANNNQGWLPGPAQYAVYYGKAAGASNPSNGGTGNAYAMIFVNTSDPTLTPSAAQLNQTAYADCTKGGMMGSTCMSGTSASAYGSAGTMMGYPYSQTITIQP